MFVTSNAQAQKIELNEEQVTRICSSIRSESKGIHTDLNSNFWRYEEFILQYLDANLEDSRSTEKIRGYIQSHYYDLKCQKIQHFPEGYLLEQFAIVDNGDGYITEFVISNHINVYEMMHSDKQSFLEWLDEMIDDSLTTEAYRASLTNVRDELNLLMEYYPFTEENIEAFYEAQWDF